MEVRCGRTLIRLSRTFSRQAEERRIFRGRTLTGTLSRWFAGATLFAFAHPQRRFADFAAVLVDARVPAETAWRTFHANHPCSIQPSLLPAAR